MCEQKYEESSNFAPHRAELTPYQRQGDETNASQSPLDRNLLRLGPQNQSPDNEILSEQDLVDQHHVVWHFAYRGSKSPLDVNQQAATACGAHSLDPYGAQSPAIGAYRGQPFEMGSCSLRCSQPIVAEAALIPLRCVGTS